MRAKSQLLVFFILLIINAVLALVTYLALPIDESLSMATGAQFEMPDVPMWLLGLANAGIILVVYGLLGLAGYWLSRKIELPGIYRPKAGLFAWVFQPMLFGVIVGIIIILMDQGFIKFGEWSGFSHPEFPMSLIASATAGIGEEILYRLFVMSLWAFLLNLALKRWNATRFALWGGNLIGALVFAAAHLPAVVILLGVGSPAELPLLVLVELFLLNGLMGLVAGERFMADGLVAAIGVHFWADVIWHVIWPLFPG